MDSATTSTTPRREPRARRRRALASGTILLFLALQAIAGFKLLCPPKRFTKLAPFRVCCSPMLWPFTDYQMYNVAYGPGVEIPRYRVIGVTLDGEEIPVDAETLGVDHATWRQGLVHAMLRANPALLQEHVRGVVERIGRPLARVRLDDHPIVTREDGGVDEAPARTLFVYDVDADGTLTVRRGERR